MNAEPVQEKLQGLRGWLILFGIGLFVAPIFMSVQLYQAYIPMFAHNTWAILTTPGTVAYHPFWGMLIVGEVVFNLCLVLAMCWLLILFFLKKKQLPTTYIVIAIIFPVWLVVDQALLTIVLPNHKMFNAETINQLLRTVISGAIWISYMLRSKRVKATFIR